MRTVHYVELTVNLYSDAQFQSHFRLKRSTFEFLLCLIGQNLVRMRDGHQQIDPDKQILVALWRMGNTESYRSISDRFDVSKATAHLCVARVIKILVNNIQNFIKWPSTTETNTIRTEFQRISGFPNTIGAIDGTHIEIEAPKENAADYVNRKGYHSLQLQAVCDHEMVFRHIFVGFPGSVHDQRVFRNSPVQGYLHDAMKFPNNTHLVGDTAYTLDQNLMTPFKDNGNLNDRQQNFNFCLSSARVTIERSFGLFKGRWRSLLNCLPMKKMERMPQFIAACCILHNICLLKNDEMDVHFTTIDETGSESRSIENQDDRVQEGQIKRNIIMGALPSRHV